MPHAHGWPKRASDFLGRLARAALADLNRLFDLVLDRELARERRDLALAERALMAIPSGIAMLQSSPFTCRKAGQSPFLRELIIPFGRSGYVALFETEGPADVTVLAVRHQLEDDFH